MAKEFHHLEGILELVTLMHIDGPIITVLVAYSHFYADYSLHLNSKYAIYDMRVFQFTNTCIVRSIC